MIGAEAHGFIQKATLMKVVLAVIVSLYSYPLLFAQLPESYKVKAGEKVEDVVPFGKRYLYPDFRKGTIYYADGTSALALINYDLINEKIKLINTRKDTTFLEANYIIKMFDFEEEVLVNDYTYGIIAVKKTDVYPKVGRKPFLNVIPVDKGISDGYSSNVGLTSSVSNVRYGRRDIKEDHLESNLIVQEDINYYIIDKNNRVYPAQSSNLYKIFPSHKSEIKTYIRDQSINMKREEDLEKLLQFCRYVLK